MVRMIRRRRAGNRRKCHAIARRNALPLTGFRRPAAAETCARARAGAALLQSARMPLSSEAPERAVVAALPVVALLLVALAGLRRRPPAGERAAPVASALREARAQGHVAGAAARRLAMADRPAPPPAAAAAAGRCTGRGLGPRRLGRPAAVGTLQLAGRRQPARAAGVDGGAGRRRRCGRWARRRTGDWLLRGVPRFDAEGQFEGYVGTARAGAAAPSGRSAADAWLWKAQIRLASCSASRPPSATPCRTTCARRSASSKASRASSRRTTAACSTASATTTSTACSAPRRA